MSDAEARFVIAIDPAQGVAGGNAVGSALEKLKSKIEGDTKALKDLQDAATRLKGAGDVIRFEELGKGLKRAQADASKLKSQLTSLRGRLASTPEGVHREALQKKINETQRALGSARLKELGLGREQKNLGQRDSVKAYNDATAAVKERQNALAGTQREFSRLGGTMQEAAKIDLKTASIQDVLKDKYQALGKMGSFAKAGIAAAVVVALVAVAASAAHAAYAIGAFILGIADAARTSRIFLDATARSEAGGEALAESINRVYQRVGGTRGEIQQLALDLRRLGLEGASLENSIEAVSATTRIFGQQAGSAIQGLIDRAAQFRQGRLQPLDLRGTGIAFNDVARAVAKNFKISMGAASQALRNGQLKVEDFTRALRDAARVRTGDALGKLALSLDAQFARLHDNIAQIFKLDDSKFLGGLHSILSLLDESTETGKALRALAKTIFQPLLDSSEKIFPVIRSFMLGMIIVALDLAIALLDVAIAIKKVLPKDFAKDWDPIEIGFGAGVIVAGVLTAIVLGLALAFGVLIATMVIFSAILWAPVILTGLLIYGISKLLGLLGKDGTAASGGKRIVEGIKTGLQQAFPGLVMVMKDIGTGLDLAFKDSLQSHSPSRLFQVSGQQIAAGVALGVEDEAPRVSSAVAGLASTAPLEGGAAQGGGGRVGRAGVHIERIEIDARGSSAQGVRENADLRQALIELFEDAARAAGLGVVTVGP